MPVSDGWTFGAGLATGRNFRNQILQEQEAERNRKRFEDNYRQLNMKHRNGSGGASPQQNVTQMNQMPTLDGGMYNGRSTPNNGVYMQGRQDMNFPKINDVTKMGNLYGDERSTPNNGVYMQGRQDMSFPKVDNVTNMGNLYGNGTNKYTFNDADYIPSKENGYHINDNPRMAEWGTPQDWQRQQVRNAMRDIYEGTDWYKLPYNGFGSAIARAEQPVDHYPQELVGLTGEDLQRAGLAYNQNIDNKYNGFRQVIQNAEKPQYQSSVYNYSAQTPQYNTPYEQDYLPLEGTAQDIIRNSGYGDDYIAGEGTAQEILANGLAKAQNDFTNAQANRAGAQEIMRGYNPQGGHSTDPNLYYDFSSILPFNLRRNTDVD